MQKFKKTLIIFLLLCPLADHFYKAFEFSTIINFIEERKKIEKNQTLKGFSDVLAFLNQLQGLTLVMRQGEILNYTNLDMINIEDLRFFDIFLANDDLKNIKYIALNDYSDPVMYSPLINNTIYNVNKSKIIFDSNSWKIFKIEPPKVPFHYASTPLQMSFVKKESNFYKYASHRSESPDLKVMPRSEHDDFPTLEPGLYDFICEMDVEVDKDTQLNLAIHPYLESCGTQSFYLKKGKNHLLTRFLHSHKPFRLVLSSEHSQFTFHNVKLSYGLQGKALSPINLLLYHKNEQPVIIDDHGRAILKSNYEVLNFEKPFLKGEFLSFKVSGSGTVTIVKAFHTDFLEQFLRWKWGRWVLSKILPIKTYEYSVGEKEKNISIPFEEDSNVLIYINSGDLNNIQNFTLSSLSIERGS